MGRETKLHYLSKVHETLHTTRNVVDELIKKKFISAEINGNSDPDAHKKTNDDIIGYLMHDIGIRDEDGFYTTADFFQLREYTSLLAENNIHRIDMFRTVRSNCRCSVDAKNSYYTRREALQITGLRAATLDKTCKELGIEPIGEKRTRLYSVDQLSSVLCEISPVYQLYSDPLGRLMISYIMHEKNLRRMNIESTHDSMEIRNREEAAQLKRMLKVSRDVYEHVESQTLAEVFCYLGQLTSSSTDPVSLAKDGQVLLKKLINGETTISVQRQNGTEEPINFK
jgi:hypothetical protein